MKFKPVDFWGAEQRKQKKRPKTEPCPYCGCDIAKEYGYVETRCIERVYGTYDGEYHNRGDVDVDESDTYHCPHCGDELGDDAADVEKYLKKRE